MEDKKIIIGGLAIVGAIALFAYLKPKPKKNSEGFFNVGGAVPILPRINPFGNPVLPKNLPKGSSNTTEVCNLPDTFVRTVGTNGGKSYCARYDRALTMTPTGKGFVYRRQLNIPDATFINGNFFNRNGTGIVTMAELINSRDYESAFVNLQMCTVSAPR